MAESAALLSQLFSGIDAAAAASSGGTTVPPQFADDDCGTIGIPIQLSHVGPSARLAVIPAPSASFISNPLSALTPMPALPFAVADPIDAAFEAYLNLRGEAGAEKQQSSSALYSQQEVWDDAETSNSLLRSDFLYDAPSAPPLQRFRTKRNHDGEVVGFEEEDIAVGEWWRGNFSTITAAALGSSAGSNSSSVLRPLANKSLFSTGSVNFVPFRPGGLDDDSEEQKIEDAAVESDNAAATASGVAAIKRAVSTATLESLFPWDYPSGDAGSSLISAPPGFERGLIDDTNSETREQEQPESHLAARKAQEAAVAAAALGAGSKLPHEGAKVEPYVAGVNREEVLSNVAHSFTPELHDEYVASIRSDQEKQLERTALLRRHISEEIDENLFMDEDEEEQAQRLAAIRKQKEAQQLAADAAVAGGVSEEDLLAELDLALPSSSNPSASRRAAENPQQLEVKARLNAARSMWATAERLDVSDFHSQLPNMAIRYPFELDVFQKEAILHLERGESVFVAAHTSAGKTVVAEYAIALAAKNLTRAIYTSPIKTLSNQKFRELRRVFGEEDVGLITGDVSINPDASCLILTTEILRSMLYKGADIIRDCQWVIFDEVHYVNDLERGVVWEEVIIMLPAHVNFVFLSATVPNTLEFADWVGRTKKKNIYVIATDKRPVPLQHFLWCKQRLFPIMDGSTGKFNSDGFKQAKNEGMTDKKLQAQKKGIFKKPSLKQAKNSWVVLINYLQKQELLPVIIFAFSKKVCEDSAYSMYNMDLTSSSEKSEITTLVNNALNRLSLVDRRLPQVLRVKDLVKRGIGLHHAGMLPILKEVVEIIFCRGLIKVLFATETFAMGVNAPTKTVVFYATRKHDGTNFRDLLPGEYTQMSGRAGRRGLDKFGIVIINSKNDDVPDEFAVKHMLTGRATRLESRFRLTYNMILNLLRQEDMRVEEMIKRSFGELITARDTPVRKILLEKGEQKLKHLRPVVCHSETNTPCTKEQMEEFFHLTRQIDEMNTHLFEAVFVPSSAVCSKYLCIGRIMVLKMKGLDSCVSVVLRNASASLTASSSSSSASSAATDAKKFIAFVLIPPAQALSEKYLAQAKKLNFTIGATATPTKQNYIIAEFGPQNVVALLNEKVEVDVTSVLVDRFATKINALTESLRVIQEKYGQPITAAQAAAAGISLPAPAAAIGGKKPPLPTYPKSISVSKLPSNALLDPLQDLKLNISADGGGNFHLLDEQYLKVQYQSQLSASPVNHCSKMQEHYSEMYKQYELGQKVSSLRMLLANQNVDLMRDFEVRMKLLQTLRYVDAVDRTVQLKGRVACEINTCPSIIVTELIFENVLTGLEPEEIVALLSCLIFQEKNAYDPMLNDRLLAAKQTLDRLTLSLGQLQLQCGLDIVPEDFVHESINWGLMQVVYEWAKGTKFIDICQLTNVLEGSIVRCITRLDETCRDVRNAARVIGDAALFQKLTKASELIKRDVVFSASLWIQ